MQVLKLMCVAALAVSLLASDSAPVNAQAQRAGQTPLNLVPWPQKVTRQAGWLTLDEQARIVATDAKLAPLAEVLAQEIAAVTGRELPTTTGRPRAGDIALVLDRSLRDEAHAVAVRQNAIVRGGNYHAVALGTVTLLQALEVDGQTLRLPRMVVEDAPHAEYRGLLLDVARKPHSIDSIKQIVDLCRLYKIRYLQLHLTNDQLWMWPSKAFPQLGSKNYDGVKPYTLEELKDLVAYADQRSVTIIPEFDVPGHAASLVRTIPELFEIGGTKPYIHHASINFVKPEVMKAVETIVDEMCEVFQSSPYFHIGGDEADLALANQNPEFQAAMKKHNVDSVYDLYCLFLVQMNEIVKKHGKKTIVWEGFHRGGRVAIPLDITVMAYEIAFYDPRHLVEDGYQVINASWTPLYVVNQRVRPPAEIYAWHMNQFKKYDAAPTDEGVIVPPTNRILGAQMCAWEQSEAQELPSLRGRLPAMAERIWNPTAGKSFDDFQKRFEATDRILEALVTADRSGAKAFGPEPVKYTSFRNEQFDLHAWCGKNVAFLTRDADLDPEVMRKLCDAFDKVYDYYHQATGRHPADLQRTVYKGRSTIAQVDNTCGAGCGYLGAKGIELMTGSWRELYEGVRDRNEYDQVLFYEFGRNFWLFEDKIEYKGDDRSGAVTTGYAVFMRFMAAEAAGLRGGPFRNRTWDEFRDEVERMVDLYVADSSLTWENTLRVNKAPRNPMGLNATDLFAGFCLKLYKEHGGLPFIEQFWHEVDRRPRARSTQDAVDNFILAACAASGKDLTKQFTEEWRWPMSEEAKRQVAQVIAEARTR